MGIFHSRIASLLCATATLMELKAADSSPVKLRYTFPTGTTNIYRFELESQGESGREGLTGTVAVWARMSGENHTTLHFRTQLRPKMAPGMMPSYRPGAAPPLSSYIAPGPFGEGRELTIDERGRMVRQAGDPALPIPLGSLASSLILTLPVDATTGWEALDTVFVLDEPMLQGPAAAFLPSGSYPFMGFGPGRNVQAVLRCRQTIKGTVKEVTDAEAQFAMSLDLKSEMLTGSENRVSATGEGQFAFDRAAGIPKRVQWQYKTLALTENLSRRTVYTLKWELLQGMELEKELNEIKTRQAGMEAMAKAPPPDAGAMLEKLKSEDQGTRWQAASQLTNGRVTNTTPEVVAEYARLTGNSDDQVRRAAFAVLSVSATSAQLPVLLKGLTESDSSIRNYALKAIGRTRDIKAAPALVEMVATGTAEPHMRMSRLDEVSSALVQLGAPAEKYVLPLLKERNAGTLIDACGILKEIGTKESFNGLKQLTIHRQKEVSEAAAEALRTIQGRIDG